MDPQPAFPGSPESVPKILENPKIQVWYALWSRKWWMLAALFTGLLAGFVWVILASPVYRAVAVIELVGVNESFMGMNTLDPQAGTGSYSATAANIQTQTRILTGSAMLGRTLERVNLEMTPVSNTPQDFFGKLRLRLGIVEPNAAEFMKRSLQMAAMSTRARGIGASRLMEISTESASPEVAATFVNTLAAEFTSQNSQFRSQTAMRTTQWLEGQLEEAKGRIEQAEAKLQEFVQKEGLAFVLDQQTLADSKLRQLQADLSAMQAERIAKQSRWELARSSSIDALPEILDDGRMKELRTRLTELRREKAQLVATLTPAHYKVQRVDAQITEIEQTLQREKANLVQRIQNDYDAALRREKLTSDSYSAQSRSIAGQAGKSAQYALLKREAEMARQIYNNLLQQANQANVVAALPTNNIRIIETAGLTGEQIRPKPVRDIPIGGLFGVFITTAIIYLLELRKLAKLATVFTKPGHLALALRLPELGVIPSLGPALTVPIPAHRRPFARPTHTPATDNHKELVTWSQRTSFSADSFRYTLTSLLGGHNPPQIVVVTSAAPNEGKTTISTNLAAAAAATGRKTLLIDGDVRRARLHHLFDTPLDPGLTELLTSDMLEPTVLLSKHIRPTTVPRLYVLPAGSLTAGESPAEILFSAKLATLLTSLKRDFDLILIDTAPALHFPDARLLGTFADGVILIVRSSLTPRETVAAVANRFHTDRVPLLGTILNDWTPDPDINHLYLSYYPTDAR